LCIRAITAAISFMKSFDKADDAFISAAIDDARRPELIKTMSRRRNIIFWLAVVISVCALVIMIAAISDKNHNSTGFSVGCLEFTVAVMAWTQVFKCESELRLLKLVEKLKK